LHGPIAKDNWRKDVDMLSKMHLVKIKSKLVFSIIFVITGSIFLSSGCIEESYFNYDEIFILSSSDLNDSLNLAEKWLTSNLREEGYFRYIYDPSNDEYPNKNNMIRQLMASRLLAEISQMNSSLLDVHQSNLDCIFEKWYREDNEIGNGYIYFDEKSKLGAIAMGLRTLVYSPFFDDYKVEAEKLANTIFSLQSSDGSFEPWYISPDYNYDVDYLLTFYSGEAILSLVEMYNKTRNNTYLDAAIKSQEFYLDRYVTNLEKNYYPAYVPWHTLSLNKLYKITGEKRYADAIMVLNDKLLEIQDISNNSTLGRFYNSSHSEYGTPHSASDGVYTEGLAYAYEIALITNDTKHQEKYKTGIILGVHNLISLQYKNSDEKVNGAMRYNIEDYSIRVDTTQHTIDAFRKIIEVFSEDGDDTWSYGYDFETGELIEYSQVYEETTNNAKWYALGIGTILSIVVLFLIYIVLRGRRKD